MVKVPLEERKLNEEQKRAVTFGEGHFNLEQGPKYKQFPELLEIIKQDAR